jgi:hypothetical protein
VTADAVGILGLVVSHMAQVTRGAWEDAMRGLHGEGPTHTDLRDRLVAVGVLTVVLDLIASVVTWLLERHEPGTDIRTFGDSLFWVSSQLLTISSSLRNPISNGARVIDIVLEIWGITIVAVLAGSFAAFFHRRSRERHGPAQKLPNG